MYINANKNGKTMRLPSLRISDQWKLGMQSNGDASKEEIGKPEMITLYEKPKV